MFKNVFNLKYLTVKKKHKTEEGEGEGYSIQYYKSWNKK